jgi:hypothetical protein
MHKIEYPIILGYSRFWENVLVPHAKIFVMKPDDE